MNDFESNPSWLKQLTTKVYLHPPRSERLVTLWPDFKILSAPIRRGLRQGAEARGFILLDGETRRPLDWRSSRWTVREDGIPIPSFQNRQGDLGFALEGFCGVDRHPSTFARLTIRNLRPELTKGSVFLLPRTGNETLMMSYAGDGYNTYDPKAEMWGMLVNTWVSSGGGLTDGEYSLSLKCDQEAALSWVEGRGGDRLHERHGLRIAFELEAHAILTVDFLLRQGPVETFSYDEEKRKTEAFWQAELNRITRFPQCDSPEFQRIFLHLTAQMLQMMVRHEGEADTAVLQGGTHRGIWPTEAVEFLSALDRIGLFHYPAEAYDYFCSTQIRDGEDRGRFPSLIAPNWACNTGAILWGLSQHLVARNDVGAFVHFRKPLLEGYEWIRRTRAKTLDGSAPGIGLFPPMQATDWAEDASQCWCWTDAWNIMGLEQLSLVLEAFGDPAKDGVLEELTLYRAAMEQQLQKATAGQGGAEEILLSNRVGLDPIDPPKGPYFADGPAQLIRAGIIDPHSETFRQVESYFRNRKLMDKGLCGLMTDSLLVNGAHADHWAGHSWYTTLSELPWFFAWLKSGQFDKAEESFLALTRYAMSSEYQMSERYADNDPAFAPWQPNASANGRFVAMMFAYFEAKASRGQARK